MKFAVWGIDEVEEKRGDNKDFLFREKGRHNADVYCIEAYSKDVAVKIYLENLYNHYAADGDSYLLFWFYELNNSDIIFSTRYLS